MGDKTEDVRALIERITSSERMRTSSHFSDAVYRAEPILTTGRQMATYLPDRYREMRAISRWQEGEPHGRWITEAELFWRQGTFMADFEDDCPYRGNFVYLGTALLQNIYGVSHVPSATLILALVIPLYNIQGVILMTVKERQGRFRLSAVLLNVLKNPMILAVLAALPFAYFKIQLPFVVSESLGYFQAATNTMALLVVGGSIRLSALKSDMPLLLRLSGVKLLLMPAIWAAMGIAAGLPAEQLVTLIIVGAMPAAVNVYIITDKMGGDGALACSAVVVTHLVSLFTMTGIVFAMRTAGLI